MSEHTHCLPPPPPEGEIDLVHAAWSDPDTRSWQDVLETSRSTVPPPRLREAA